MGNTTIKTTSMWTVRIISVNPDNETVEASWNNNGAQTYGKRIWSKWRETAPVFIKSKFSIHQRLATKAEIAALKIPQKFKAGTRVRIADDLGIGMSHFPKGVDATVEYSYREKYGGADPNHVYSLNVDGIGSTSWYKEDQLTEIK